MREFTNRNEYLTGAALALISIAVFVIIFIG